MELLTISLGRGILEEGSRERNRMHAYAGKLEAMHVIVLTRKCHGFVLPQHNDNLTVYPTNSISRIVMLWDAFWIGRSIVHKSRTSSLIISAQDPLEIGWVCWILSLYKNTQLHIQVHGDYFNREWLGRSLVKSIKRFFALMLLKHTPAIRVVSERIRESLIMRGVPGEKITVLPIRPELEQFLVHTVVPGVEGPYTFIYVGRLSQEKNISRIIRAFSEVHNGISHIRLRIVGSGPEEKVLKNLTASLGITECVDFIPWTENIAEEMARADVLLLASKHEAYGLVLLEAMAVGLPMVTTDVGCVGEVVKNAVHGIVVYKDSDESFAQAMRRMIGDFSLRQACSMHGKETAKVIATRTPEMYVDAWVNSLSKSV